MSIGLVVNAVLLLIYMATRPVPMLPMPSLLTAAPGGMMDMGDGWYRTVDTVVGCAYLNVWDAMGVLVPMALCTGTVHAGARRKVPALVTTGIV
jgi:hypothetical protein